MHAIIIFALALFTGASLATPLRARDGADVFINGPAWLGSSSSSAPHAAPLATTVGGKAAVAAYIAANGNKSTLATGLIPVNDPRFAEICVYHHNVHRLNHSAATVSWSTSMASQAQAWANSCSQQETIPAGSGFGMNVAFTTNTATFNPSQTISDSWYNNEIQNYPAYGVATLPIDQNFNGWGHFSELVWPTVKQIGCGYTTTCAAPFATHFACYYSPEGNIQGQFNTINPPDGAPIVRGNGE